MTDKPPTIGQLKRKIERLEARLAEMEVQYDKAMAITRQHIYDVTDANMRIEQAAAILRGEE